MELQTLLEDYKKPGGTWTDKAVTREQKKRLIENLNRLKMGYEEEEVFDLSRSKAQHVFSKLGEIRREEKAKKAAEEGESKSKSKKKKKRSGILARLRK